MCLVVGQGLGYIHVPWMVLVLPSAIAITYRVLIESALMIIGITLGLIVAWLMGSGMTVYLEAFK